MIWGKTKAEIIAEARKGRWWYAWRPIWLDDGRWVWLHRVWTYKDAFLDIRYTESKHEQPNN